jgi:hypothetical protein
VRTYAQKPKASQQTPAAKITLPGRISFGQRHESDETLNFQRTIGNQAVQRNPDSFERSPNTTSATSHLNFDFSRISIHSPAEPLAAEAYAERSNHHGNEIHRNAAGPGPTTAPAIVHDVLRTSGRPIPADVQHDMEVLLGHDFADVRVHTDERASASAEAVAAHAYTVGRHVVFATGRFDPGSAQGRRLLAHELTHAASHPPGVPTPSGDLRISTPTDAAERYAVNVSEGSVAPAVAPTAPLGLFRQGGGPGAVTGVTVNHRKVTVPPVSGLSFSATKTPANASGVTLSVVGDNATIDAGTTIDNSTGAITVAAAQTGGSAHVEANQTGPGGATSFATAPFHFTAIPSGITSTTSSASAAAGFYGGEFTHTFTSPGGGQTALERSHVNEQFAGVTGTTLTIAGPLTTVTVAINDPNSATAGWDLDSSGTMTGPDLVDWGNTVDARPFVANASHPSPSPGLPQALTTTQNFRNLTFPSQTYRAAAVASTTHRRAFEDRSSRLKAVTSAGIAQEIVEDYMGPTVFRRCHAAPDSIPVAAPAPPRGTAPAATTSTITVDAEGQSATPTFSIVPPDLGCTITAGGVLTPGTTPGTVTVRAGDAANFDQKTVTLTARPATPTPSPTPAPKT